MFDEPFNMRISRRQSGKVSKTLKARNSNIIFAKKIEAAHAASQQNQQRGNIMRSLIWSGIVLAVVAIGVGGDETARYHLAKMPRERRHRSGVCVHISGFRMRAGCNVTVHELHRRLVAAT
jgi:hypothetical protein